MNQLQKAAALEMLMETPGWDVLEEYLIKNSTPCVMAVDSFDSLIKQAYRNGVCQGHIDVLNFIKITISNAKRKIEKTNKTIPYPLNIVKQKNTLTND